MAFISVLFMAVAAGFVAINHQQKAHFKHHGVLFVSSDTELAYEYQSLVSDAAVLEYLDDTEDKAAFKFVDANGYSVRHRLATHDNALSEAFQQYSGIYLVGRVSLDGGRNMFTEEAYEQLRKHDVVWKQLVVLLDEASCAALAHLSGQSDRTAGPGACSVKERRHVFRRFCDVVGVWGGQLPSDTVFLDFKDRRSLTPSALQRQVRSELKRTIKQVAVMGVSKDLDTKITDSLAALSGETHEAIAKARGTLREIIEVNAKAEEEAARKKEEAAKKKAEAARKMAQAEAFAKKNAHIVTEIRGELGRAPNVASNPKLAHRFRQYRYAVIGRSGVGKSTALRWLGFYAGMPRDRLAFFATGTTQDRSHTCCLRAFSLAPNPKKVNAYPVIIDTKGIPHTRVSYAKHILRLAEGRFETGLGEEMRWKTSKTLTSAPWKAEVRQAADEVHVLLLVAKYAPHATCLRSKTKSQNMCREFQRFRNFVLEIQSELQKKGKTLVIALTHFRSSNKQMRCEHEDAQVCADALADNLRAGIDRGNVVALDGVAEAPAYASLDSFTDKFKAGEFGVKAEGKKQWQTYLTKHMGTFLPPAQVLRLVKQLRDAATSYHMMKQSEPEPTEEGWLSSLFRWIFNLVSLPFRLFFYLFLLPFRLVSWAFSKFFGLFA